MVRGNAWKTALCSSGHKLSFLTAVPACKNWLAGLHILEIFLEHFSFGAACTWKIYNGSAYSRSKVTHLYCKAGTLNKKNSLVAVIPVIVEEILIDFSGIIVGDTSYICNNGKLDSVCLPFIIGFCSERNSVWKVSDWRSKVYIVLTDFVGIKNNTWNWIFSKLFYWVKNIFWINSCKTEAVIVKPLFNVAFKNYHTGVNCIDKALKAGKCGHFSHWKNICGKSNKLTLRCRKGGENLTFRPLQIFFFNLKSVCYGVVTVGRSKIGFDKSEKGADHCSDDCDCKDKILHYHIKASVHNFLSFFCLYLCKAWRPTSSLPYEGYKTVFYFVFIFSVSLKLFLKKLLLVSDSLCYYKRIAEKN